MQMAKISAGLLMYKKTPTGLRVFLVHPGGPFWAKKDTGAWSIPKGLIENEKNLLETAKREFAEETVILASQAPEALLRTQFLDLGNITYKNGKIVYCWAFEGNLPENFKLKSNPTPQGWPEMDKGDFFSLSEAKVKINTSQAVFLDRLTAKLK